MRVDPIPREVAGRNRRNTGSMARRDAERRQIRNRSWPRLCARRNEASAATRSSKVAMNALGELDRCPGVQGQAVELHHAGIDFGRRQYDACARRALHQPRRHRRSDDHAQSGPAIDQCVDDFDGSGRVAEAVAGNIENDRSQYRSDSYVQTDVRQPRHPLVGRVKRAGSLARSIGAEGGVSSMTSASSSFGNPSS